MAKMATIVSIDSGILSIVEVIPAQDHACRITNYYQVELPTDSLTPARLQEIWQKKGFSNKKISLILPSESVKYRSLTLPILPEEELQRALQLELEDSINDFQNYTYQVISQSIQNQMNQVKIALVSNSILNHYYTLFTEAGLIFKGASLHLRGNQNFINYQLGFLDNETVQFYLDIASNKTEIVVFKGREILYNRQLNSTEEELMLQVHPEIIKDFNDELRLSLIYYQKSNPANTLPKQFWGFGRVFAYPKLVQDITSILNKELVSLDTEKIQGIEKTEDLFSLVPLIGIALEEIRYINPTQRYFISEKQRKTELKNSFWQQGLVWATLIIIVLTGFFLIFKGEQIREQKKIKWLQSRKDILQKLQQTMFDTKAKQAKLDKLVTWTSTQGRELQFLNTLIKHLPVGTTISNISMEEGLLKDLAGSTPSVSRLLQKLKRVPELARLKLKGNIIINESGELFHLEEEKGNKGVSP